MRTDFLATNFRQKPRRVPKRPPLAALGAPARLACASWPRRSRCRAAPSGRSARRAPLRKASRSVRPLRPLRPPRRRPSATPPTLSSRPSQPPPSHYNLSDPSSKCLQACYHPDSDQAIGSATLRQSQDEIPSLLRAPMMLRKHCVGRKPKTGEIQTSEAAACVRPRPVSSAGSPCGARRERASENLICLTYSYYSYYYYYDYISFTLFSGTLIFRDGGSSRHLGRSWPRSRLRPTGSRRGRCVRSISLHPSILYVIILSIV